MFLLRSIFWLTVAYVAIHPGTDLRSSADALSAKAVAAGQQMIAEKLRADACASLQCQGVQALAAAVLVSTPSSDSTMQDSYSTVPVPRPRPHWMG